MITDKLRRILGEAEQQTQRSRLCITLKAISMVMFKNHKGFTVLAGEAEH